MPKPEIDIYFLYVCPFCSGDAKFVEANCSKGWLYWVKCTECGSSTPAFTTKEECQDIWNRRKGVKWLERHATAQKQDAR